MARASFLQFLKITTFLHATSQSQGERKEDKLLTCLCPSGGKMFWKHDIPSNKYPFFATRIMIYCHTVSAQDYRATKKTCPDLKLETRRNERILGIFVCDAPLSSVESCPTFSSDCVASIFQMSDNAPNPSDATLIFSLYCSRLRDSASTQRVLQFCHLHKLNTCLHCWWAAKYWGDE